MGQSNRRLKSKERDIQALIPNEMHKYRFILHPFRLSMLKLLDAHFELSSQEIKQTLDLSWSDFSVNINALKKKEYVTVRDDFDDTGRKRQYVTLAKRGEEEYKQLKKLLEQFLTSTANIVIDDSDLYPHREDIQ